MWQQEKKDSFIVSLALSLSLATLPMAANFLISRPVLAESTTDAATFPLPQTVENGTTVRIDGSNSLVMINQNLKDDFEKKFSGTKVEVSVNGTDAALQSLLDGKIDIAAIARRLTPAEQAQGLEQVNLRREKIAIVVGANNPFKGGLTSEQFAKIFRGEITDWSEIGGSAGKIRFIDHPPTSDTRNSFRNYPAFKSREFATGANAIQVTNDNIAQIIKELGTDGITYVMNNQVSMLPDVRKLKIQEISPDNSRYPFSQPLVYVYKQNPSPGVANFLGFTTANPGKKAIEAAINAEAAAIAARALQSFSTETTTSSIPAATPTATASQSETSSSTVNSGNEQQFVTPWDNNPNGQRNIALWIVLSLLPIVGLGGFLTWWLRGRRQSISENTNGLEVDTSIKSVSETTSDEYSLIPSINNTTPTNGTSHHTQNTTSTLSNTEENFILTDTESLGSGLTAIAVKEKNTPAEDKHQVKISAETIALDCGEVVWDTEAPVAVVKSPYPSVPNISELPFDLELPTDDLTNSLLELLDEPSGASNQHSTTSLSELLDEPSGASNQHSTTSLSELLNEPAETSNQHSTTSLSELLNEPAETSNQHSTTSLSELLNEPAETSNQHSTTSLSELLNEPAETSNQHSTTSLSELLNEPSGASNQHSTTSLSELLNEPAETSNQHSTTSLLELLGVLANSANDGSNTSLLELLGVLTTSSDGESNTSLLKLLTVPTATSDQDSTTSLSELLGLSPGSLDVELPTDEIKNSLPDLSDDFREVLNTLTDEAELKANLTEEVTNWSDAIGDGSIVFTPRTPKWAYVSWYVSETQKQALQNKGGNFLAVRLYDVTDIDLSYQIPQLVQQYECEEATHDRYLAIPQGNRDYMTEIGYVTYADSWLCIARSGIVRVFSRSSADFWFVTDTELVIQGATEPGTTVTINGNSIKLKSDGTFHFRVPFSDNLLNYLITATSAKGGQQRTISKKFSQESSDS
ncbi:substrate-binding domain-containing protein [Trichormus variabilis]|uniref:substrate-binding domain-containing protein n=1 Tax=Anabaena variabilis TaxID=264691 RepID=UPI001682E974|nr:substrate-binding domain-containing protein [Trichormus variabilis]MBD2629274.1 substrate-binding domain-containing protein [Trichormus variabilis FACHB-164]